MDRLLRVGDVFTSSKMDGMLYGEVLQEDGAEPYVEFSKLHLEDYELSLTVNWTERGKDGWTRRRETKLSTKVKEKQLLKCQWRVIHTDMTGGGTGHGPHDVYPDGHHVVARRVNGEEEVRFYQSGCFVGMLDPKDIRLVKERDNLMDWYKGPCTKERIADLRRKLGTARGKLDEIRQVMIEHPKAPIGVLEELDDILKETADE